MTSPVRLNKFIADRGFASRREADKLIADGRVVVNGKPAVLGQKVTEKDRVEIANLGTKKLRYVVYYKPTGMLTLANAKGGDDAVSALARDHGMTGLFPVGRLDRGAEGLLLFTNDGRVTGRLVGETAMNVQEYELHTVNEVTPSFLSRLERQLKKHDTGVRVRRTGSDHRTCTVSLTRPGGANLEGTCTDLGHHLTALRRTRFGTLELTKLGPGETRTLTAREATLFRKSLNLAL